MSRSGGAKLLLLSAAAAAERDGGLRRLATTFDGDAAASGVMFDVKAKANGVAIRGLDVNVDASGEGGARYVEVWTKEGSFRGHEEREGAWRLWLNETVPAAYGAGAPTHVSPRSNPLTLSANERRAFYVIAPAGDLRHSARGDRWYYIDREMVIYADGAARGRGFGGATEPSRSFNGALYYSTIRPRSSQSRSRKLPSGRSSPADPPPAAEGTTRALATSFAGSSAYVGAMFDVVARDYLEVRALAFHTHQAAPVAVNLYTKEGTCQGSDWLLSRWTRVASLTVQGQGSGGPTYIPEGAFDPILIRRNARQAFYIASNGPYLRASEGTSEGSISAANGDMIIYEGIGKSGRIVMHSVMPRQWNGIVQYEIVDVPPPTPTTSKPTTARPTRRPSRHPTLRPTSAPTIPSFRLRLYWERGYYWQEERREQRFCMKCGGSCRSGDSLYVDGCSRSSSRQRFVAMGDTIRPARDHSLCLTVTGYSEDKPLRLYTCRDSRVETQSFVGFQPTGKFELQPKGDATRCVSQQHHPRDYERIYPEDCAKTRSHDTTYWVVY